MRLVLTVLAMAARGNPDGGVHAMGAHPSRPPGRRPLLIVVLAGGAPKDRRWRRELMAQLATWGKGRDDVWFVTQHRLPMQAHSLRLPPKWAPRAPRARPSPPRRPGRRFEASNRRQLPRKTLGLMSLLVRRGSAPAPAPAHRAAGARGGAAGEHRAAATQHVL